MTLHSHTVGQNVRELAVLVGDILEAQTSTNAFETVERLRTTAIDYRNGELDSRDALDRTLRGLILRPRSQSRARSPLISRW